LPGQIKNKCELFEKSLFNGDPAAWRFFHRLYSISVEIPENAGSPEAHVDRGFSNEHFPQWQTGILVWHRRSPAAGGGNERKHMWIIVAF
jgi:hypothetical protein